MQLEILEVAGISISEPVTSFTDLILASICFILCARVRKHCHESIFNNAWRLFFLFTGISTLIGALAHGLQSELPQTTFNNLWLCMNISGSISVFFSLKATVNFIKVKERIKNIFNLINGAMLITFLGFSLLNNDFEIFKIHIAIGLLMIFFTHLFAYIKNHFGSGFVTSGLMLSFITVFIHSAQISISSWFNYKDISHVIMMISLWMIYQGIYRMSSILKISVFRERNE